MKLSVVMPLYNEERTLREIIKRVQSNSLVTELVIVDGSSTDTSSAILTDFAQSPCIKIFRHELNQGKGAAIRTGLSAVTGDIVVIQDADLEYDPAEYGKL